MIFILFIAGLILLTAGAEALVRGASRLSIALNISPLIIGLTVVAYGTGAPEIAVSVHAAVYGHSDITVGNIIGSNVINILLILGLAALIRPLAVSHKLIRFDVPLLIIVSVVVLLMAANGSFSRFDGLVLLASLFIYTTYLISQGRKMSRPRPDSDLNSSEMPKQSVPARPRRRRQWIVSNVILIFAGFVLLVLGADWLLRSAVELALMIGLSELIVGLTIVALGTSLPELATSVLASLRNERSMAIGNIVGSCLFNLLGVLGLSVIILPGGLSVPDSVISFDMPLMIATAVACLPIFFTGGKISRWEGALFLGYYIAYTLYLIMAAAHHEALPFLSATMLYFVAPLTGVTLFILALLELQNRRNAG